MNLWNILGIIGIVALIFSFRKEKAVWGGFTLGSAIGLIAGLVFLIKGEGFKWEILRRSAIIGTLSGLIIKLLSGIPKRKSVNRNSEKGTVTSLDKMPNPKIRIGSEAYNLGKKFMAEKREKEALESFDVAIDYGMEAAHRDRAYCLQGLSYHLDALDDFNKSILFTPKDASLYFGRSFSKDAVGDYDGSVADIRKAIKLLEEDNDINREYNDSARDQEYNTAKDKYKGYLEIAETAATSPEKIKKMRKKYLQRRK